MEISSKGERINPMDETIIKLTDEASKLLDRQSELVKRFNSMQGIFADIFKEISNVTEKLAKTETLLEIQQLKLIKDQQKEETKNNANSKSKNRKGKHVRPVPNTGKNS